MAIAQKGEWWREQRGFTAGDTLRGVVNAGVRWVLVGENAGSPIILTVEAADEKEVSPTYTARTPAGSDPLHGVAYVAVGLTVAAVGENGVIEESTNQGQSWTSQNVAGSPDLYDIASNSGDATSRFIAAGVNEIWGQDNLGTWTQRWSGVQTYRSVAYKSGNGFFAAGDSGFGAHSPTGAVGTWTAPFAMAAGTVRKVRANSNYFIAVGDDGLVWRSATGLSGSFNNVAGFGTAMRAVVPLAATGLWAAFDSGFGCWFSSDDGDNWTPIPDVAAQVLDGFDSFDTALACGGDGRVLVSYAQTQVDYVAPESDAQEPGVAFNANADMAGDAVRRLITQFRSGRG